MIYFLWGCFGGWGFPYPQAERGEYRVPPCQWSWDILIPTVPKCFQVGYWGGPRKGLDLNWQRWACWQWRPCRKWLNPQKTLTHKHFKHSSIYPPSFHCGSKFCQRWKGRIWKFISMPSAAIHQGIRIPTLLTMRREGARFEPTHEIQTALESRLGSSFRKPNLEFWLRNSLCVGLSREPQSINLSKLSACARTGFLPTSSDIFCT